MIIFMCREYEHTIVITNRALVQGDFLMQMEKAVHLHPHALILREKDLTDEEYEQLAGKVLEICRKENVACFLHSRIAISRKVGCKRIHLSIPILQNLTESERTRLRKEFEEISISCHSLSDVQTAVNAAEYVLRESPFTCLTVNLSKILILSTENIRQERTQPPKDLLQTLHLKILSRVSWQKGDNVCIR